MMPRRYRSPKRAEAVQETRRKILLAAMQLHGEQGIMATSWEDIAQAAGVSLATVYRYFPTLNELLPACGGMATEFIRPPTAEMAESLFAGADSLLDRVERVTGELCAFYDRAAVGLTTVRREGHLLPPLAAWGRELDEAREMLVRAALRPAAIEESVECVALALTAFPAWQALVEAGVPRQDTPGVMSRLVLAVLSGSKSD